ncbi:MAG: amidohydrolase family protein [Acidobacteriota bacterium]
MRKHLSRQSLSGKVIDLHSHVGVSLKAYARGEYPYAQSIDDLRFRQRAGGVDVNVVFPIGPDLFLDLPRLVQGDVVPSALPVSPSPFELENANLLREVFVIQAQTAGHFMPFVCIDPGRAVPGQLRALERLDSQFPIYGIKVNPVFCQSKITGLLEQGRDLLDFARERNLPLLLHVASDPREAYSYAGDTFKVIERHPDLRYCLAHCLGFHRGFLEQAAAAGVWVDTAALKITVDLARQGSPLLGSRADWIDADYSDHKKVMRALIEQFPRTIVWGSDSPWYTFFSLRKQAEGMFEKFELPGTYEEEKAALDALPPDLRRRARNGNTLDFLFGKAD